MAAKAFLEQYMDCMDALPLELQRFASQYWEIDCRNTELVAEAQRVQSECTDVLIERASSRDKIKWLIQLQRLLVSMMEIGSDKLDVTSQMLDTVEGYSQQLALTEKEMVSCRTRDELTGNTRNSTAASSHGTQHKTTAQASLPALLEAVEKKKSDHRNQKRARTQDKVEEYDPPPSNGPKEARRDSNASSTANILPSPSSSSTTNTTSSKSIKNKKVKTKKKNCVVKEQQQSQSQPSTQQATTVPTTVPIPDFTTEPIDPDEPTYCLCNQVSFGEMIGCDNDDCPIEWFHFQCVGLTAKPKGKWYCPQCQAERAKHRSGKT